MLQKASVARCLGLKVGSKVEVCGVGVLARHRLNAASAVNPHMESSEHPKSRASDVGLGAWKSLV